MILYKQITYINIDETVYKLAKKYTISRTHDEKKYFTFDEFVSYQKKRKLPHVNIASYNTIPTIVFHENEGTYNKGNIHNSIEIGTFTTITQTDKYTFDELKTMLSAQEFIKCIINMIKEEGML